MGEIAVCVCFAHEAFHVSDLSLNWISVRIPFEM